MFKRLKELADDYLEFKAKIEKAIDTAQITMEDYIKLADDASAAIDELDETLNNVSTLVTNVDDIVRDLKKRIAALEKPKKWWPFGK